MAGEEARDPDFILDRQRTERTGLPEALFCERKSPEQIDAILAEARGLGRRMLLTRLDAGKLDLLAAGSRAAVDYDAVSRPGCLGYPEPGMDAGIGIVCAGTSDLPVAREAQRTLRFHDVAAPVIADVGVAGLWRLVSRLDEIRRWRVVIAAAGMEGALFSVVSGLVPALVIAVPTSVGYGVAEGGRAALSSALASCAPGLVTVNIDNGFGAACAALKAAGVPERPVRGEETPWRTSEPG